MEGGINGICPRPCFWLGFCSMGLPQEKEVGTCHFAILEQVPPSLLAQCKVKGDNPVRSVSWSAFRRIPGLVATALADKIGCFLITCQTNVEKSSPSVQTLDKRTFSLPASECFCWCPCLSLLDLQAGLLLTCSCKLPGWAGGCQRSSCADCRE